MSSLELVHGGSLSTVVFRYVPERKGIDEDELNAAMRQRLFDRGDAVIGHTRVRGRQCLKFTFMNPSVSEAQIEELVGMVVECGRQLERNEWHQLKTAAELRSAGQVRDLPLRGLWMENCDSNSAAVASRGHSGRHASKIASIIYFYLGLNLWPNQFY